MTAKATTVLVRATVHLRGLAPGDLIRVDPSDAYIKTCISQRLLVPADLTEQR